MTVCTHNFEVIRDECAELRESGVPVDRNLQPLSGEHTV